MTSVRTVFVTGGSHGLGATLVRHMAGLGNRVVFTYGSSRDRASRLEADLSGTGVDVVAVQADATSFTRAHEVIDAVVERFGHLHVLINNVGGAGTQEGPIWTITEETWDAVVALNLKSCFNYTHAAAPHFIRQGGGTIVNVGSINGLRGKERQPAYTAAKGGVLAFTKTIAKELGPHGVNVNMIATGYIETEKQRAKVSDEHRARILESAAMKHLIEPDEVAGAVAFLCSAAASHMTGCVLKLDSGEYI